MKTLFLSILSISLFCIPCNNANDISPDSQNNIPKVKSNLTYDVIVEKDIVYAEGLSHESINSINATKIPLKLDVYIPDNNLEYRPVYLYIHGGGFGGGSKQQSQIINSANYFTSRGWVFISIDYRLKKDMGTVPQQWANYLTNVPKDKARQFLAIYPAVRDAKAALRWVVANADKYKINTNYITVGGSSAGAITAITLGVSNQEDFRDEISISQDPTLTSTNLEQSYLIRTVIDLWGSKIVLYALNEVFGHQRFDTSDPSLFIAHGTDDSIVPFSSAEELKSIYETNEVPFVYYALEGEKHGPWDATINNKRIEELAFDFIVEQQSLIVEYN